LYHRLSPEPVVKPPPGIKKQDGQSVGVGRGLDPKRERVFLLPEFAEGRAQQAVEHTWRLREGGGPALYFA